MNPSRRSTSTAAGWYLPPDGFVRPKCAARRRPSCWGASQPEASAGASTAQVRCDASRSMRAMPRPSSSFETRARLFLFCGISSERALLRMRTTELAARRRTVFGHCHLTMSNSPARSRGAVLRPGLAILLRSPESRGGRSAERRSGARRNTCWAYHDAIRQALARRLASHDAGRSPLGAPPWRFFTRGRASVSATRRC